MISKEILGAMFGHFTVLIYIGVVVSTQYGHGKSEKSKETTPMTTTALKIALEMSIFQKNKIPLLDLTS